MKKKLLVIIIISITLIILYWNFRLNIEDYFFSKHAIYWSNDVKLEYADFQDDVDLNSKGNISYYHGLYLKANSVEKASVRAFFDKKKSWIKNILDSDINQSMEFQKLRFDLHEVYARKFNSEIDKIRYDRTKNYSDLEKIGEKIFSELNAKENEILNSDKNFNELIIIWRPKINDLLKQSD